MIFFDSSKRCIAISFETSLFLDLEKFLFEDHGVRLDRIDPYNFLSQDQLSEQYINLVVNDLALRKQVSQRLDALQALRFSYVHPTVWSDSKTISGGVLIYPNCTLYRGVQVDQDVIIHGQTGLGHQSSLGKGSVVSGGVIICGSAKIEEFCVIGARVLIFDKVSICNNVVVGAGSIIRQNITEPGTYTTSYRTAKLPTK